MINKHGVSYIQFKNITTGDRIVFEEKIGKTHNVIVYSSRYVKRKDYIYVNDIIVGFSSIVSIQKKYRWSDKDAVSQRNEFVESARRYENKKIDRILKYCNDVEELNTIIEDVGVRRGFWSRVRSFFKKNFFCKYNRERDPPY